MDLARNPRSGVIHRPECPRTKGEHGIEVAVPYKYGKLIPDEAALSGQTRKYQIHLCKDCLPGICECKDCSKGTHG